VHVGVELDSTTCDGLCCCTSSCLVDFWIIAVRVTALHSHAGGPPALCAPCLALLGCLLLLLLLLELNLQLLLLLLPGLQHQLCLQLLLVLLNSKLLVLLDSKLLLLLQLLHSCLLCRC
jgi:hypothetical protein